MSWFRRAINKGADQAVSETLTEAFKPGGWGDLKLREIVNVRMDEIIRKMAYNNEHAEGQLNPTPFVWQCAFEFMRTDRSMKFQAAKALAISTVRQYLRDEKIKFGDTNYDWSWEGAKIIAREYETDHWETNR